jgi:hypothetical protein
MSCFIVYILIIYIIVLLLLPFFHIFHRGRSVRSRTEDRAGVKEGKK